MKQTLPKTRTEVKLKTTDAHLTSRSGLLLFEEFAHKLDVAKILDETLTIKKRNRGYSESEFILPMVYCMLDGASCLDDIGRLRDDTQTQKFLQIKGVPHATTIGDFLKRFNIGHIYQLIKAQGKIRKKIYQIDSPDEVTIDQDSKVFEKHGHQEGVDMTYQGIRGYHPQFAFRADTAECVYAKLQRGSAYTARAAKRMLTDILRQIPESAEVVHIRSDSGWYQEEFMRACEQNESRTLFYYTTADMTGPLAAQIQALPEEAWSPFRDKGEEVAELLYTGTSYDHPRRIVVKRRVKDKDDTGQCLFVFPEFTYHAVVTNNEAWGAVEVMEFALKRATMENYLKQLQYDLSLDKFPCDSFHANWAYLLIGILAYNLAVWMKAYVLPESYRGVTLKTLRYRLIHVAGQVIESGRRVWLGLKRGYTYLKDFREALRRLRQLYFT